MGSEVGGDYGFAASGASQRRGGGVGEGRGGGVACDGLIVKVQRKSEKHSKKVCRGKGRDQGKGVKDAFRTLTP